MKNFLKWFHELSPMRKVWLITTAIIIFVLITVALSVFGYIAHVVMYGVGFLATVGFSVVYDEYIIEEREKNKDKQMGE